MCTLSQWAADAYQLADCDYHYQMQIYDLIYMWKFMNLIDLFGAFALGGCLQSV